MQPLFFERYPPQDHTSFNRRHGKSRNNLLLNMALFLANTAVPGIPYVQLRKKIPFVSRSLGTYYWPNLALDHAYP